MVLGIQLRSLRLCDKHLWRAGSHTPRIQLSVTGYSQGSEEARRMRSYNLRSSLFRSPGNGIQTEQASCIRQEDAVVFLEQEVRWRKVKGQPSWGVGAHYLLHYASMPTCWLLVSLLPFVWFSRNNISGFVDRLFRCMHISLLQKYMHQC